MTDRVYYTVGELARRVGVTVRTLQYYDQQGLLSPSAKGPQNQRLYSLEDETTLYRILCLKYLNLSLSDIAKSASSYDDTSSFEGLIKEQLDALQDDFQNLLRRMATLRGIGDLAATDTVPNWNRIANEIENKQAEPEYFWRMTAVQEVSKTEAENGGDAQEAMHLQVVADWHNLIADTITVLSSGIPLESPQNADLAHRYRRLLSEMNTTDDGLILLIENMSPHGHAAGSFDEMRGDVMRHLKAVSALHAEEKE